MGSGVRVPRPAATSRLTHIRALDGLRGVAILVVMLYNLGTPYLGGGFLGVDMFFVLSGFLITAILLHEWERTGSLSLKAFFVRRGLRLLPALLTLLTVILLLPGVFYSAFRPWVDSLIVMSYSTNWVLAFRLRAMKFYDHTWSLTVEEQFYVVWPILLLILLKARVRHRNIIRIVIGGIAFSTALRFILWTNSPDSVERIYYGLDTRFDSLLYGCLVGLLVSWDLVPRSDAALALIRGAIWPAALALAVLCSCARPDSRWTYEAFLTVACVAVSVILINALYCPSRLVTLVLDNAALAWIGRISYGLYLWHDPIFFHLLNASRMSKLGISGLALFVVRLAVTFAVAGLSFYLIEKPCLKLKRRFARGGQIGSVRTCDA